MAKGERVLVLVLGDVGHSPRMQYHALSLANTAQLQVEVVGYTGSAPFAAVTADEHIRLHLMKPWKWTARSRRWFTVLAPLKVVYGIIKLMYTLLVRVGRTDYILVQNPPSIPSLACVTLCKLLWRAKLTIDWHNFGYTLLGLGLRKGHPFVGLHRVYERWLGRCADDGFCVTQAMQGFLKNAWNINAHVLYDRPPRHFKPLPLHERHELFTKLHRTHVFPACPSGHTWFTEVHASAVRERPNRPLLIISSTSWTPDEDFGMLLSAVERVEEVLEEKKEEKEVKFVFVITGKGPQKAMYEARIAALELKFTRIWTAWLEADDYPKLLGSADWGVSLHSSSSALDLPMKVVDMFGAQLPVLARDFACLGELVRDGENGHTFSSAEQLADLLLHTLTSAGAVQREEMRTALAIFRAHSWEKNWATVAVPMFASTPCSRRKWVLVSSLLWTVVALLLLLGYFTLF